MRYKITQVLVRLLIEILLVFILAVMFGGTIYIMCGISNKTLKCLLYVFLFLFILLMIVLFNNIRGGKFVKLQTRLVIALWVAYVVYLVGFLLYVLTLCLAYSGAELLW